MLGSGGKRGARGGSRETVRNAKGHAGHVAFFFLMDLVLTLGPGLLSGPISQMDVLLNLATFVPVFMGLVRSINDGPERILAAPDCVADYIQ